MNKELQELILAMIMTAKLIGYRIECIGDVVFCIYIRSGQSGPPYMVLALIEIENDENQLHTFCNTPTILGIHHSHEEKVDHLKSLLQKL